MFKGSSIKGLNPSLCYAGMDFERNELLVPNKLRNGASKFKKQTLLSIKSPSTSHELQLK